MWHWTPLFYVTIFATLCTKGLIISVLLLARIASTASTRCWLLLSVSSRFVWVTILTLCNLGLHFEKTSFLIPSSRQHLSNGDCLERRNTIRTVLHCITTVVYHNHARTHISKPTPQTASLRGRYSLNREPALTGSGKRGNVTSAFAVCDPIWHVSSSSGEAGCKLLYFLHLPLLYLCCDPCKLMGRATYPKNKPGL